MQTFISTEQVKDCFPSRGESIITIISVERETEKAICLNVSYYTLSDKPLKSAKMWFPKSVATKIDDTHYRVWNKGIQEFLVRYAESVKGRYATMPKFNIDEYYQLREQAAAKEKKEEEMRQKTYDEVLAEMTPEKFEVLLSMEMAKLECWGRLLATREELKSIGERIVAISKTFGPTYEGEVALPTYFDVDADIEVVRCNIDNELHYLSGKNLGALYIYCFIESEIKGTALSWKYKGLASRIQFTHGDAFYERFTIELESRLPQMAKLHKRFIRLVNETIKNFNTYFN